MCIKAVRAPGCLFALAPSRCTCAIFGFHGGLGGSVHHARRHLFLIMKPRLTALLVCAVALAAVAERMRRGRPQERRHPGRLPARAGRSAGAARAAVPAAGRARGRGPDAFRRQLADLRGYPVVVNKWASWCGPCRHEFPFFQRQVTKRGKQVAFLAVNSEDAREPAQKFLQEIPVPYPSFLDPDSDDRQAAGPGAELPDHDVLRPARASRSTPSRAATRPRPRWPTTCASTRSRRPGRARRNNPRVMRNRRDRGRRGSVRAARGARVRSGPAGGTGGPLVQSVALDLTINPASAAWVDEALEDAEKDGADLVIFRLDTPGGLDDSTRDIVKDILAAPMPVVVYVSPERRARRVRRPVHHPGGGRRGDGARDEHRLGDADLARRRRAGRGAGPQGAKRRRGIRARARGGPRPQRRPRGAHGARRGERDRDRGRSSRTWSTSSRPTRRRCCASSTGSA